MKDPSIEATSLYIGHTKLNQRFGFENLEQQFGNLKKNRTIKTIKRYSAKFDNKLFQNNRNFNSRKKND